MNKLLSLIQFLSKRPSDATIRISRIIYGMLWIGIPGYFFGQWEFQPGISGYMDEGIFLILGIFPILWGITNHGVAQKKWIKKIQFLGVFLAWIGAILIHGIQSGENMSQILPVNTPQESYEGYLKQNKTTPVQAQGFDASSLFVWLGISTLLSALTGKMITSKNLKYKEVITKIRI